LNEKAAAWSMELRDEKNVQSSRFKVQKRGGFNVEHRTLNIERKGGSREHGVTRRKECSKFKVQGSEKRGF
jgi:hypothetical protein